ncbi:GntR family transcriptional regulator, partial [Staphylococcus aureus]|uniref:GntR family transcriptional regulator n=1 Tax=Staphylococcus aureus TaxID=1280 RepID=UPI000AD3B180
MKNTLYHQLYEKLKKQIIEGQFKEGDKFYSKRQLSKHLSISQTTVEHAYQLLLDEGYIYSRPRSGYFVSEIESLTILNNQPIPSLFDDDSYVNSGLKMLFYGGLKMSFFSGLRLSY